MYLWKFTDEYGNWMAKAAGTMVFMLNYSMSFHILKTLDGNQTKFDV